MDFRRTLSNGVEVIANTNPHLRSFCATVRIRAGSAYERKADNGITHLMEHCIVRSLKGRFSEPLGALMSRSGLYLDARTGVIRTEFEISGSPAGLPLAAEMFRKMFLPIELSAAAYRLEKERILQEMIFRQGGGPHAQIDWEVTKGSTVGQSPLGTPNKIKRFSRNQINALLRSLLVPGNVVLCLTGGIDDEAMTLLLEAAEAIPMYEGAPRPGELKLPDHFGERDISLRYAADIDYMRFVFDMDPEKCPKAVMDLLRAVLFSGPDALLHRHLSEDTGLVYGYAWPFLEYRNFGFMEIGFHFAPDRLQATCNALQKMFAQLRSGEFDLESRKLALRAGWECLQDNTIALNAQMLHHLTLWDSPEPPDWESVTKEDVIRCADIVFSSSVEAILYRGEWEALEKKINAMVTGQNP